MDMIKTAIISDCGQYRYELTREWDSSKPRVCFVMLNPSVADANIDDNTIKRCISFAKDWGYGSLIVVNLFAYRATKPADLKAAGYQVGECKFHSGNVCDHHIAQAVMSCHDTVCAWGAITDQLVLDRASSVLRIIHSQGRRPKVIKLTAKGHPRHPLYLKGNLKPIPFQGE